MMVNITMNGQKVSAPPGSTILQAAKQAGIDIPTLCDHPALIPIGACRICVVDVQGQRTLMTACTFPITEGMVVETESPKVVTARKFILDMLFSERNHYCPFCEASGDCELQKLGYRYGLDHWIYPTYTKPFQIDASHKYLIMEQNRCVLCGRCERACSDLAANYTLGLRNRGNATMVHCDAGLPWGESTCISCGTCSQVCPTGAIFYRRSSFMGREVQTEHIKSTCSHCSMGCGTVIITRGGNVLRIDGDWDAKVSGGRLCRYGRFDVLYDERGRVTRPLLRREGKLEPVSWDEALQAVADRVGRVDAREIGVLTSSNCTNEALYLLGKLFRQELKTANVGLLNDLAPKLIDKPQGSLAEVTRSDVILVVGADPVKDQPVLSFLVKRSVDRGARLVVVDGKDNGLAPFASMNLEMSEINKAVEIAEHAGQPIVLYGAGVTEQAAGALKKLQGKAAFVALEPGVNTYAAVAFGLANGFKPSTVKVLYALLGEQDFDGRDVLKDVDKNAFIAVQASFISPLIQRADVVLPMAIWSERTGSLTNTEGRVQKVNKAVEPAGEAKPDWEVLSLLAEKLGKRLGASLDEISVNASRQLK
ncbi:MAG: molybdopterin-dependent oxidoreductase [Syntrophobacteraceae bacterium]